MLLRIPAAKTTGISSTTKAAVVGLLLLALVHGALVHLSLATHGMSSALVSVPTLAATAGCPGDLCGSKTQGRANLINLNFKNAAALTLTGFVGALPQSTLHNDAHAL